MKLGENSAVKIVGNNEVDNNQSKKFLIYLIENKITGKVYVGQTCQSFNARMKSHSRFDKNPCIKLATSIRKHGWENFDSIVLEQGLTLEQANIREEFWISHFDSVNSGYNLKSGGLNKLASEESKLRLSQTLKSLNRVISNEERERRSNSAKKYRSTESVEMKTLRSRKKSQSRIAVGLDKHFYKGESIFHYCRSRKISYPTIMRRIEKGWSVEKSVETPIDKGSGKIYFYEDLPIKQYCEQNNLNINTVAARIRSGYSVEQAINFKK